MTLERAHVGRQQAEGDRAAAVAVIDAVDDGRKFPAPGGLEQVRLMPAGGNEIEQHDADRERLMARDLDPKLIETAEQKSRVARLVEIDLVQPPRSPTQDRCSPSRRQ